ncbi:iron-hydroxamate ABC transporter substrate-binding protein [Paenactinomyces guangxiensis]|uniref:Iron-hydroxamate ABC transporter substrate-binding protein n=1 Tax=Paenactinomyces guangxiensis TaxID=1490290 RepID=A0A7W1WQC9_9BACL|nr:iron-hydroxamate ABC transporter substrate-binding protein [Paenactinomyces guangxiensis]MBA4493994.1 iron-hydroxamate ABC transporter substrate-binding protein [Paenactinomyces guangxiensis]MBH8593415.1 iron-hydroxamate ABC transporter substrate-binding protein [Paenactinomyces guangxiensis]
MKVHKRYFFLSLIAVLAVGLLAACSGETSQKMNPGTQTNSSAKTRIYHSENGDIEVPANPKRIAVLAPAYAGNLLKLGITPIAVDKWPKGNKFYEGKLDDVEEITEDSLEKLLSLNPDLIIAYSNNKNIKKYSEIAPTVSFTYEKYNYLEQHIEIGKLVGKEKEARAWVEEWQKKAQAEKKKVREAIGENATATVIDTFGKDMYVYGDNWGRGTEVIYQALGLKAPKKVEQEVFGRGYKAISAEVIPQYAGDYIFVGQGDETTNHSFMETDVWKGIPAVQKNHVIKFDSKSSYFNDPITLEKEMEFIVKALTKGK